MRRLGGLRVIRAAASRPGRRRLRGPIGAPTRVVDAVERVVPEAVSERGRAALGGIVAAKARSIAERPCHSRRPAPSPRTRRSMAEDNVAQQDVCELGGGSPPEARRRRGRVIGRRRGQSSGGSECAMARGGGRSSTSRRSTAHPAAADPLRPANPPPRKDRPRLERVASAARRGVEALSRIRRAARLRTRWLDRRAGATRSFTRDSRLAGPGGQVGSPRRDRLSAPANHGQGRPLRCPAHTIALPMTVPSRGGGARPTTMVPFIDRTRAREWARARVDGLIHRSGAPERATPGR